MNVLVVVESIVSLFIMIMVGVYASRRKIITDKLSQGLIDILIQIALPFMIISSFLNTYDSSLQQGKGICSCCGICNNIAVVVYSNSTPQICVTVSAIPAYNLTRSSSISPAK